LPQNNPKQQIAVKIILLSIFFLSEPDETGAMLGIFYDGATLRI